MNAVSTLLLLPHRLRRSLRLPRATSAVALLAGAALAFGLAGAARADDYADVNQLLRTGKPAEALSKADAYIAGKPRDPQMRFLRGIILTEQGRQADAITAFTQLTQDFPELPEPYNNLAALYAQQSEFDKARAALETSLKLNPKYTTAQENLGDVYARLAAQAYGKVQQLEPGSTSVPPKLALIRQIFNAPSAGTLPPLPPDTRKAVRR